MLFLVLSDIRADMMIKYNTVEIVAIHRGNYSARKDFLSLAKMHYYNISLRY